MFKHLFTWNPQGLRRLSFRGFQWFPLTPYKQLEAAVFSALAVVLAAGLAAFIQTYIAIPNLNMLFNIVIAFFMADRIHPHPVVGPVAVTLPIIGVAWLLFQIPDTVAVDSSIVLTFAANLFLSLFIGALLAVVFKVPNSKPQKD